MCMLCTIEQQTIWASETLLPHSTLDVMHHYKAENMSSWIVLVSTHFAFSLYVLVVPTFRANQLAYWLCRDLKSLDDLAVEMFPNAKNGKG
jgi:hypothetical protein